MKIAFAFHRDADNPAVQSSRPFSILRELRRRGVEVVPAFPLGRPDSLGEKAKKALHRVVGKRYRADREPSRLAEYSNKFKEITAGKEFDIVFSPGSEVVAHLPTNRPIAFCADATFANLVDYYWDYTNLSADYIRQGHELEQAALSRAALAIYPSEWAARAAIDFYKTDPSKVAVIPFGANFGRDNRREDVEKWIERRPDWELRLLFVGREWERKGGDIAVEAAKILADRNIRVRLDIVGVPVPPRHGALPWIHPHGLLRAGVPHEAQVLTSLFEQAHFVVVPSRAEAYGMTFCEANAFGVPAVGAATGGIPTIIKTDVNGLLMPLAANGKEYADEIQRIFSDQGRYQQMALDAYDEFAARFNWAAFCRDFLLRAEPLTGSSTIGLEGAQVL